MYFPQSIVVHTQSQVDEVLLQEVLSEALAVTDIARLSTQTELTQTQSATLASMINQGRFVIKSFSDKQDFRNTLAELYTKYELPTILYFGSLSNYSEQLQEGMLRLLEEPPENAHVVLTIDDWSVLLPTIKSRVHVVSLQNSLIFKILHKQTLDKLSQKLPNIQNTINNLLNKQYVTIDKISTIEREEIGIWLWQISMYLEIYYKQSPSNTIANVLEKVTIAKKYNTQNLQKKLIIESLNL
jgi:DNA polymerase III, delta subunit